MHRDVSHLCYERRHALSLFFFYVDIWEADLSIFAANKIYMCLLRSCSVSKGEISKKYSVHLSIDDGAIITYIFHTSHLPEGRKKEKQKEKQTNHRSKEDQAVYCILYSFVFILCCSSNCAHTHHLSSGPPFPTANASGLTPS